MATQSRPAPVTIRRARAEDAGICGRICHEAFYRINTEHGFPPDVDPERSAGLISRLFSHPGYYCVVAESDGRVAGSNCMDERSAIAGIGPITIDPGAQNRGVGRMLMQDVLDRVRERGFPGVRLVQAAFHNRSLSLYASMGFEAREPLSVMNGPALHLSIGGCTVRPARDSDLSECNRICAQVHGHDRSGELAEGIQHGTAAVVERGGRITGYTSAMAFFGHSVAETDPDLFALIGAADEFLGPGILVPTRNAALFRWCLSHGLRVVEPMTLMTIGLYNEPAGAWLPSILY